MRSVLIISALILVSGCATNANTEDQNIIESPMAKPNLPGCLTPPEKRPLRELSGNFWQSLAEVDALMMPVSDPVSGATASPQYSKALTLLEPLLNTCNWCSKVDSLYIYQRAAIAHYHLGHRQEAVEYFKKMLDLSPVIPESLEAQVSYQVGTLLLADRKYAEALTQFDHWESLCPKLIPSDYPELRRRAESEI